MDLNIGDAAPDINAPGTSGDIKLADLAGKSVVLYFYPKDDTSGCTAEAQAFSDLIDEFAKANAVVLGVSKDTLKKHEKFIEKYDLKVALLSAAENDLVERYGAWVEKSMYGRKYMGIDRSTFVIGPDGLLKAIWRKVKVPGHAQAVLNSLKA
jgi:peroxiredoxin Q/BCP